mmetsp:Transcript_7533/g.18447  ORF Transcript_7533/g.18447 Transcript_7533/m.18447 type:complete len:429 (+) Transcript_7533:421-1707(+)
MREPRVRCWVEARNCSWIARAAAARSASVEAERPTKPAAGGLALSFWRMCRSQNSPKLILPSPSESALVNAAATACGSATPAAPRAPVSSARVIEPDLSESYLSKARRSSRSVAVGSPKLLRRSPWRATEAREALGGALACRSSVPLKLRGVVGRDERMAKEPRVKSEPCRPSGREPPPLGLCPMSADASAMAASCTTSASSKACLSLSSACSACRLPSSSSSSKARNCEPAARRLASWMRCSASVRDAHSSAIASRANSSSRRRPSSSRLSAAACFRYTSAAVLLGPPPLGPRITPPREACAASAVGPALARSSAAKASARDSRLAKLPSPVPPPARAAAAPSSATGTRRSSRAMRSSATDSSDWACRRKACSRASAARSEDFSFSAWSSMLRTSDAPPRLPRGGERRGGAPRPALPERSPRLAACR